MGFSSGIFATCCCQQFLNINNTNVSFTGGIAKYANRWVFLLLTFDILTSRCCCYPLPNTIPNGQIINLGTNFADTLLCLSFRTPKNNKFSICSKWKIDYFYTPQNLCSNIGTPKTINFPFGTNGKLNGFRCPNT